MKLELFGIEICAGIDAYSRYITWIYVGVSARQSQFSVATWIPSRHADYFP